jgi:hypothetical protein
VSLTRLLTPVTSANIGLTLVRSHQDSVSTASTIDLSNRTRRIYAGVMTQFTSRPMAHCRFATVRAKGRAPIPRMPSSVRFRQVLRALMYEAYFGLRGKPFQLNPDPSFFMVAGVIAGRWLIWSMGFTRMRVLLS